MRSGRLWLFIVLHLILGTGGAPRATAQTTEVPAHWYGKWGLTAGYGNRKILEDEEKAVLDTLNHFRGEATLQLGYMSPKFSFSTHVKGQMLEKDTDFYHAAIKNEEKMEFKSRQTALRQPSGSWRTDFQWKPSDRNQFSTFLLYQIERDKSLGATFDMKFDIDGEDVDRMGFSTEERRYMKQTLQGGWRSTHLFPERHLSLITQLDGTTRFNRRHSLWEQSEISWDKTYLLTPRSDVHEGKALALLRNDHFCGVPTLLFETALQARSAYTEDRNGGKTQIAPEVWRDSLSIQERFDHLAIWLEPGVNVDYRIGTWHFRVEATLQWYGEQLTDERHFRDLVWDCPNPVGRILTEWAPSKMHRITASVSHSVKQPPYVQRCWFERQGANADQLFRGNPDLAPSLSQEVSLIYNFRQERFSASSQSRLTYRTNEVERTFTNETIDGRKYKVFTWLNTAYGKTFSQVVTAGWSGSIFSANARLSYSQKLQQSAMRDREVRTHHWEFSADASCRPGKGWSLSARGAYVGDVQTLYSLLEGYCSLSARVEKAFKKVTVFIEGRDLLDQPVEKEFTSADLSERWSETEYLNRRVFLTGFTWSF